MNAVTETWWAKRDAETMADFAGELPAVLNTSMELWQMRVDRGVETPFVPHTSLFVIVAVEYAHTEIEPGKGRSEPTGREFSLLVAADDRKSACSKVKAQLAAHGFKPEGFMLRTNHSIMCLA